jgi:methylenetetrahydrofolate dehydrogenase (NADP+)/methenyltetrahydrofolate cyclohydrolase
MKFPGKEVAARLEKELKKEVAALKKKGRKPHLVAILAGESPEQSSFVAIKRAVAKRIGIQFTFVHLKKIPSFEEFAHILKKYSADPTVNGIIIQQPLPPQLQTDSMYGYIPGEKEIEGHKEKSPFFPPLGLATLTTLKYVFMKYKISPKLLVTLKDIGFLKKNLKNKRIVLIGRGVTGGHPIGKTLGEFHINYLNTNSETYNPHEYYQMADIIITSAGQKVLKATDIKSGVMLLNVGLRHDGTRLVGDYEEKEIKDLASFYTPTPGGIGPIDVLYLYSNLIDATKMQKKH